MALRKLGAQRWNVWNRLPHQVSGAIERLEPTRLMGWRAASFFLEIAFRRQKVTAKLLNDAFYRYLILLNQDVALVRPGESTAQGFVSRKRRGRSWQTCGGAARVNCRRRANVPTQKFVSSYSWRRHEIRALGRIITAECQKVPKIIPADGAPRYSSDLRPSSLGNPE
jgi:hypothetical protein